MLTKWAMFVFAAGLGLGCQSVEPRVFSPGEIASVVRAIPSYTRFGITGLAFFQGDLYASSNIGLLKVHGERVKALYSWSSFDPVIESPWIDQGGDALWMWDVGGDSLLRLDGHGWSRIDIPRHPRGWYSRGEVLSGFRAYSSSGDFWIQGAGVLWRWDREKSGWTRESVPEGSLAAWAPLQGGRFAVRRRSMRAEGTVLQRTCLILYAHDGAGWREIPNARWDEPEPSEPSVRSGSDVLLTPEAVYLCSRYGVVSKADKSGITRLETPSPCEAIIVAGRGTLLASFRDKGIYAYEEGAWRRKLEYPALPKKGEHWAYLAEHGGTVAFATTSHPDLVPDRSQPGGYRTEFSGSDSLWLSAGGVLRQIQLVERGP